MASGEIKPGNALIIMMACIVITAVLSVWLKSPEASVCLLLYFVLNVTYSFGLKNQPIIDIVILASGFVISVFYGGFVVGEEISKWKYLVVTT